MPEFHADTLTQAVRLATLGFRRSSRLEKSLALKKLDKRAQKFNFVARVSDSDTLFVGEGNFSFALSLARRAKPIRRKLCATSLDSTSKAPNGTRENMQQIERLGGKVKTGIDATRLSQYFCATKFDLIVFQFPNLASRVPVYGQNANHWLVTRFLKSALKHLRPTGEIVITTVDNPHYEGVFKMDEAARKVGCAAPDILNFSPTDFPLYSHENTPSYSRPIGGTSALQEHRSFATFVFRP